MKECKAESKGTTELEKQMDAQLKEQSVEHERQMREREAELKA